jgi:hypothetical protein
MGDLVGCGYGSETEIVVSTLSKDSYIVNIVQSADFNLHKLLITAQLLPLQLTRRNYSDKQNQVLL